MRSRESNPFPEAYETPAVTRLHPTMMNRSVVKVERTALSYLYPFGPTPGRITGYLLAPCWYTLGCSGAFPPLYLGPYIGASGESRTRVPLLGKKVCWPLHHTCILAARVGVEPTSNCFRGNPLYRFAYRAMCRLRLPVGSVIRSIPPPPTVQRVMTCQTTALTGAMYGGRCVDSNPR